jgi:hypothetical protein
MIARLVACFKEVVREERDSSNRAYTLITKQQSKEDNNERKICQLACPGDFYR